MCTAISDVGRSHLFGRTLDLEFSYGEEISITPRDRQIGFIHKGILSTHYAFMGVAHRVGNIPLYYDGVNECGVCGAALSFPSDAVYNSVTEGKENLASFEVIPYILASAKNLYEVKELLGNLNITDEAFSTNLSPTPLHWIFADRTGCIILEQTAGGTDVYDNPFCVMTNSPTFPYHRLKTAEYLHLTASQPKNELIKGADIKLYSRGMGAIGLPGDFSSTSRFVRALFLNENSKNYYEKLDKNAKNCTRVWGVTEMMHVMDCVSIPIGCAMSDVGKPIFTVYTVCCDLKNGCYYYTTYENRRIRAVQLSERTLSGDRVISYPLIREQEVLYEN